ncbi:MAG TPA: serine/threonine-protein kinase, partial [Kofleriaceae bacterium]|nr:serine/threonine-protein kinase [Kofleriaceae bacterium]
VTGVIDDPGVFATDRDLPRTTLAAGMVFVLAVYILAYYSARALRAVSVSSIEGLQRATRLASQRKALMDELRADLERALRVGGPGRHTDHTVGSFKLGMVIGRGAMGEVYEATHVTTGESAAVKLLRRELLADPTHVARFVREARASGSLASAHVVRVLECSVDDGAVPFIAMERLHGQTLAEMLRRDGRLTPESVLQLCTQVGEGIDAASAVNIVHRDLKPQNLFLDGTGWKILDFGVATLGDDTGTLTAGGVVGTPSYMAPEQARGNRVDGRADVYAIAAVAYRCLTGRHPFTGPDTPALLYAVVHRMPARPSELAPLDPDIDRWVALALAKSPDDRFASGAELSQALAQAIGGTLDGKLRRRADALVRRRGWEVTP